MLLNIKFYINKAVFYYNKSHLEGPRFKRGDKVYLLRRNIKIMRPLDKLNYKKIKLFEIVKEIRLVNFRLKLLETIRINLVFYTLLLELVPYNIETFTPELDEVVNETIKYEVEEILKRIK